MENPLYNKEFLSVIFLIAVSYKTLVGSPLLGRYHDGLEEGELVVVHVLLPLGGRDFSVFDAPLVVELPLEIVSDRPPSFLHFDHCA